jgi:hypothetical protein
MVFDGQVRSGRSMVGNARYFEEGSLSMVMEAILLCAAEIGLPNDNEMKRRGDAIQPGSRALTRQRLRCCRSRMRVLKVFMPSTLTSGVGDGKRSEKIERNA